MGDTGIGVCLPAEEETAELLIAEQTEDKEGILRRRRRPPDSAPGLQEGRVKTEWEQRRNHPSESPPDL